MHAAAGVFESLAEPTGVEEDWRYVEFDHSFDTLEPALEPGERLGPGRFAAAIPDVSGRVLIVDGSVVESDPGDWSVSRLSETESEPPVPKVAPDHNKLAAAHAAFSHDGVFIDIEAGAVMSHPMVVEVHAVTAGTASFPTVALRAGENSEARVVVVYRSAPGSDLLMIPGVGIEAAAASNVRFVAVQDLDLAGSCVVHQRVRLGRDATCRVGEVGLGGKFGRLDLGVDLVGDGSSSEMVGLYFGEGHQTLDYRMLINHSGRSTSSDVFLKGAVEDDAQSVFTGLLRIEKDAVKTSTFETNRNLVLSDNAKAHSVPNLEILCNDVICGHGSSVGPLEEEHLYYLMSRGLTQKRAERLLIKGFFQEVIDRLPIHGMEDPISTEVFRRFAEAQEAGRVA
ncbi:MAG: Fe-S cluster assembly protein SufD [Acidimicrobiia bacterium]|nr:Fe-S cluster assembly protein SufD [Acidimicrobiia bacterium]